ncbi:F-actin-monooxygenase MICAL2 isoform X2 [Ambystoma mexicanum]|uniref:F-actin-monooxygenase MICAL2 isoform X2 n=1 Tax=Ambystoma mexicanum TaxID=8296 RepID=UPI0037E8A714
MGENDVGNHSQAGQLFENFVQASTCKGTLQAFNILTRQLELDPLDYRNFYTKLKAKVSTWKAKALWNKLDKKTSHKEYKKGRSAINTKCLVIGGGPCGLRSAIELASLGAKVVVVEKRDTFSRNNVLHLWPFTIHDLRGLGAKKFYGKFCAGSIDHISIRQLQLILFKVALLLGVEIHVNLEFVKVLEPAEDQECKKVGWRAEYLPIDHPLSEYEFDVIIGADGRRNTLEGFRRKEFRGKLAIAITANFINRNTTAEAKVEEISGVAFIFNQKFFQDLKEETGIDLENIVYYKDSTHYFVMTAKKQSLLDKGVIINDYIDTEMLLSLENVNQENLLSYAREAADFATNYQLPTLDYAINHYGQPDVAMFDFTSMHASENAALIRERHGHHLLVALVGDSLLEPFWPMGTGCARGFFAVFDTVWMVKGWAQAATPLELLAERESLYRLLPQTTPENISKNFDQYTIDPGTRYPNLNSSCVRPNQVRHLYLTNELQHYPVERASSIRRSVKLSRHESDVRPNKLLTWCQKQTEGYKNVNVIDLATSWKSGLALCAIIHHFRPELIDFDSLNEEDAIRNNQLAFDVAEKEFGIPPITTGKEMASTSEPDKLSMVMYLSKFYELFRGTPLRVVDNAIRENGTTYPLKTSNGIYNNHINLTLPRKRVPKLERKAEENDSSKRRRKGAGGDEPASFSSHSASSGSEYGDSKEGTSQNKVKSMATQLLAKFEDNAPNGSLRRQSLELSDVDIPACFAPADTPVNPRFAKPKDPPPSPPAQQKRQFQAVARTQPVVRDPRHCVHTATRVTRESRIAHKTVESASLREPKTTEKKVLQPSQSESTDALSSSCTAALAIAGILDRLQHLEEKISQKRAQSLANREFHKKSIKDKAAHLASLFGCDEVPQLLGPSDVGGLGKPAAKQTPLLPDPEQMTVGKVSRGVGAMAQVLINLYLTDHRPKVHSTSPERTQALAGAGSLSSSSPSPCVSPVHSGKGSLRKEFPTNIGGSDICYFCKKRVYVMERLSAEGHFFHRECFKCNFCSATLRLAAYAFDVDEGKFYCKPHFIYCKTNNKQRKRRVELNAQMQEEAPMWKKEEPAMAETVRAGAFTTVSGAEDSSPDIIYQSSDEATSPKKFRNVPEFHKSRSSSVSSEWASVKIIPEEEMAEHNLLAVRVMVTSDGSSSEIESDVCGNNSKSEFSEHWYTATEPELRRSPLKRIISLDHCNTKQEDASRPSKAAAALHRASSFQASPSNDQQNWRKMIRSSFTFIGKKPELPSNEPSLNSPKSPDRDLPTLKVCSSEMTTETLIPRFPILQGKSIELQREIPSYVPHSQQLPHCTQDEVHKVNRGFQTHGIQGPVLDSKDDNARTKLHPSEKVPKSGQEPPPVKPPLIERNIAGYSRVKEDNDSTIIRKHGAGVGHDLSENLYLKKLVLSKEEKADLLDWNHRNTQRPSLEFKRHPTMDISDPAPYTSNPHRTEGKLPHLSVPRSPPRTQGSTLASLVDRKDVQDIPKAEAEPAAAAQSGLGSPFRIIASVFKRSLNSSPESNKNTSNQKPQPLSSSNILKFSSAAGQSGGLRRSQSHVEHVRRPFISGKPSESSLHKTTTSGEADINTLNTTCSPSNLSTGTVGTFSNPIFEKYPDNKMDAPMLKRLERVTIKDISPKDPTDDIFLRNRKNSFFSSLRFRDKPSEIITDRPKAKSDLWNIIGTIRKKVNEREMNDPEKRTATPFSAFFTENVLNNPFAKQETGSKHLPARSSFNGDYSSSSDDEWDTKPPSSLKARRTSKRRKKLEREAKQKIKQEELKRLHKAQSIQRQLQEIEERQHALEIQGVKLEKAIREKSDSGAQDDGQLLQEWFKLVMEKNTLIRYESELLIIAQGLELEDHQSRLEQKLREKMSIDDSQKDEKDKKEEQVLLCEKMRVIEQRDKLVSFLEQQRLLEKAEDSSLENIMSSQGYQFNVDRKQGYEDAKLPTTCWNLH